MNSVRLSFWVLVLIAAVIVIAFVVSILPQEIIWIIFILLFAVLAFFISSKFWKY